MPGLLYIVDKANNIIIPPTPLPLPRPSHALSYTPSVPSIPSPSTPSQSYPLPANGATMVWRILGCCWERELYYLKGVMVIEFLNYINAVGPSFHGGHCGGEFAPCQRATSQGRLQYHRTPRRSIPAHPHTLSRKPITHIPTRRLPAGPTAISPGEGTYPNETGHRRTRSQD